MQTFVQQHRVVGIYVINACCSVVTSRNGGGMGEPYALSVADAVGLRYERSFTGGYPVSGQLVDWADEQGIAAVEVSVPKGSYDWGRNLNGVQRFLNQLA